MLDASRAFDRVEYVKLFRLLMSKGICPIIGRFLVSLYTNQLIRVRWGNCVSVPFSTSNGVKQGGVMSPILFTLYIDELLYRMSQSQYGCYIGNQFHGAYGYADDVIVLAPSLQSLNQLLNICCSYALEYNVKFNPTKSKLIMYTCNNNNNVLFNPRVEFMGGVIDVVQHDKHLGNLIGHLSQNDIVSRMTNDFLSRVNMVKFHFKYIPTDTMYFLFKTYCMPLYGCQLIDLSSPAMSTFYVAWRKSIRYLLNIPRTTHCSMLNYICDDIPVFTQLCNRFIKFLRSLQNSKNPLINTCYKLIILGSQSSVSNSVSIVTEYLNCDRGRTAFANTVHNIDYDSTDAIKSNVVRDLLHMKHMSKYNNNTFLSYDEISFLLNELCTC